MFSTKGILSTEEEGCLVHLVQWFYSGLFQRGRENCLLCYWIPRTWDLYPLSKMLPRCLDKHLFACLQYLMDFWDKCPLMRDRMGLLRNKTLWPSISYQNIPCMNEWNWEPVSWISHVLLWLWLKRERRVLFRLNSLDCNYAGLIASIYIYMAIDVLVFWLLALSEKETTNC